jgi:hypothetical protein
MDAHVSYLRCIPGGITNPNAATRPDLVPAFSNDLYTVVFTGVT